MVGVTVQGAAAGGSVQVTRSQSGGTALAAAQPGGGTAAPASTVTLVETGAGSSDSEGGGYIAGDMISGDKAVMLNDQNEVVPADPSIQFIYAGLATSPAQVGQTVKTLSTGEYATNYWQWTPGRLVFVAPGGDLTQTAPETGYLLAIGRAVEPTIIRLAAENMVFMGE